jgi:hypothetical protein
MSPSSWPPPNPLRVSVTPPCAQCERAGSAAAQRERCEQVASTHPCAFTRPTTAVVSGRGGDHIRPELCVERTTAACPRSLRRCAGAAMCQLPQVCSPPRLTFHECPADCCMRCPMSIMRSTLDSACSSVDPRIDSLPFLATGVLSPPLGPLVSGTPAVGSKSTLFLRDGGFDPLLLAACGVPLLATVG